MPYSRERAFNVPAVVVVTVAVLVAVHAVRDWVLSPAADRLALLMFAFFPARFDPEVAAQVAWPGGTAGAAWSFVTYALLHGDWAHLSLNAVWLLAFGSAVARRFGPLRYLALFVIAAAAGAAAHLLSRSGELWPMVGASAAISGYMAAAIRFVFQAGGPLGVMASNEEDAYRQPAEPLLACLRDGRVLVFLGVWFGLNLLFAVSTFSLVGEGQSIAWEAHIGGFVAGLVLFPLFDPVPRRPAETL